MLVLWPWRPIFHGAVGPWDEIIGAVPVAIGIVLLLYLYFTLRRRPARGEDEPAVLPERPPPDPKESP